MAQSAAARNLGLQSPEIRIYPTLPCAVAAYENGETAEANQLVDWCELGSVEVVTAIRRITQEILC